MLRKLSKVMPLLFVLIITSCKEEEKPCSDKFVADLNNLNKNFSKIYSPDTTNEEFSSFTAEVKSFISNYPEKCQTGGDVKNPNPELEKFLTATKQEFKVTPKVVYGNDDRVDIEDAKDPRHATWASSVAVQMSNSKISQDGTIQSETIGESMSLCKGERFREQINPGRCSGFLVGKDILVTAGHCIQNQEECDSHSWVFGFNKGVTKAESKNTYKCKSIISRDLDDETNADFAVIKLDRNVEGRSPLKFRSSGKISNNSPIVVIGHPSGLPMKIADGANVRSNGEDLFFVGNLDTFGGNSGSPVFNNDTGLVEGILVRGENDYDWVQDEDGRFCRETKKCRDNACRGEDVSRITKVTGLPEVPSSNDIYNQLFANTQTSKEMSGIAFPVYTRKDGDKFIAGIQFLSTCALHYADQASPKEWSDSKIADCTSEKSELVDLMDKYIESL
jgi:V8-like Glu-specific endopeptidase